MKRVCFPLAAWVGMIQRQNRHQRGLFVHGRQGPSCYQALHSKQSDTVMQCCVRAVVWSLMSTCEGHRNSVFSTSKWKTAKPNTFRGPMLCRVESICVSRRSNQKRPLQVQPSISFDLISNSRFVVFALGCRQRSTFAVYWEHFFLGGKWLKVQGCSAGINVAWS